MQLPVHHHRHDEQWIREKLETISMIQHPLLANQIAEKYSETFQRVYEEMKPCITADNKARCEANTRLRVYVEKLELKVSRPNTI
jgi:hypothetical protein